MSDISTDQQSNMDVNNKSMGTTENNENRPQIERQTTYWKSLEEFYNDDEFQKALQTEFMSSPIRDGVSDGDVIGDEVSDGWKRRDFLKLMGASLALSAAGCIRRPVQKIIPYNKQPEEITFGVSNYYTSSYFDGSEGLGLLVKTREGRPIKIEGNPSFPLNKGGVSSRAQASILSLYDPERLQGPRKNLFREGRTNKDTIGTKWEDLDKAVSAQLLKGNSALLTGAISSPSTNAVVNDFCQAFGTTHYRWEAMTYEDIRAGQKASYGDDLVPFYRFDKANVIVTIDADFLGTWLQPVAFSKQFAANRKNIATMNRLISFDSTMSLTANNADVRVRIKPTQQIVVAMGLISELMALGMRLENSQLQGVVNSYRAAVAELKVEGELFKQIAKDLWDNRGQGLVVGGGLPAMTEDALQLQVMVNIINSGLGNDGVTVLGRSGNPGLNANADSMNQLIEAIEKGNVKTLIIHRVNPAYSWMDPARFVAALKKVEMVIYTGDRLDEVGHHAHYIAPDNHAMETWGDAEFSRGVFSIQQPTIRPLYDTRSFQLSLMNWAYSVSKGPKRILDFESYYDYLRNIWKTEIFPSQGKGKSFEDFWALVLQQGFIGEISDSSKRSVKSDAYASLLNYKPSSGYELVLYPTVAMGDGTLANVAWLQELPDPVTKIVWDNYAMVSVATAEKEKLSEGSVIEISLRDKKLHLPVHIQPGLHDDVVAVPVGYGRTAAGKVANNVGFNVFPWASMNTKTQLSIYSGQVVSFKKTTQTYKLACVQSHHSMEGRQIVVEATLKDYLKKKDANIHKHPIWTMWPGYQYNGHKWAMSIDLNTCTGCSSCMTACQSENNIPVVGKKYVLQGREMHWIRVDRYYTGDPNNGDSIGTVFQPVTCQHCDNAPCETVCPVLATVHSSEGLNEMVYNRCVGTRYCSNNCPYKVRRFNWFNYAKLIEKPQEMAMNPDVTVRIRGVMEKCSFCVQRIKEGKNNARMENRKLKDGDVKTACQVACPSDAIVFGDVNDPESQVAKTFRAEPRAYALLEEWNAAPSFRYLSKIRNNNKETAAHGEHGEGHGASSNSPKENIVGSPKENHVTAPKESQVTTPKESQLTAPKGKSLTTRKEQQSTAPKAQQLTGERA